MCNEKTFRNLLKANKLRKVFFIHLTPSVKTLFFLLEIPILQRLKNCCRL